MGQRSPKSHPASACFGRGGAGYERATYNVRRKRKERERKKSSVPSATDELHPVHDPLSNSKGDQESAPGKSGLTGATYTVHVSVSSSALEWYNQSAHSFATPTSAREAGIWDYPATADERAQCAVFRDLWEKGYSMGGGIKFGGDYLVYPSTHFSILATVFVEHSVHPL